MPILELNLIILLITKRFKYYTKHNSQQLKIHLLNINSLFKKRLQLSEEPKLRTFETHTEHLTLLS